MDRRHRTRAGSRPKSVLDLSRQAAIRDVSRPGRPTQRNHFHRLRPPLRPLLAGFELLKD